MVFAIETKFMVSLVDDLQEDIRIKVMESIALRAIKTMGTM